MPPSYPLLSPRPPVPPPPVPGPSKATEVMEDFSKLKQPTTVPVNTFYTSIEPWIRNIKEEDIGFLEFTADEMEPYIMPKLGRPYAEVWEEEDTALYGGPIPGFVPTRIPGNSSGTSSAPVPKWDPSTLGEVDLVTEGKGHGPLTERLISSLLPMPDIAIWKGVKAAEEAMEGRPGGSGAAAARKEKMNVSDLEERVRDTMRFHGLLNRTVSLIPHPLFLRLTKPSLA
jgi:transcriptional adapter 3